jgi:hypothetical protein
MSIPTVDLSQASILAEIVVRAGNAKAPGARQKMQEAYEREDPAYLDAIGLSTIFRLGATLDELASEGHFPHAKISYSIIGRIIRELGAAGYTPVLQITPTNQLPDHHTLAVAQGNNIQPKLSDAAADALIRALDVFDNPYR